MKKIFNCAGQKGWAAVTLAGGATVASFFWKLPEPNWAAAGSLAAESTLAQPQSEVPSAFSSAPPDGRLIDVAYAETDHFGSHQVVSARRPITTPVLSSASSARSDLDELINAGVIKNQPAAGDNQSAFALQPLRPWTERPLDLSAAEAARSVNGGADAGRGANVAGHSPWSQVDTSRLGATDTLPQERVAQWPDQSTRTEIIRRRQPASHLPSRPADAESTGGLVGAFLGSRRARAASPPKLTSETPRRRFVFQPGARLSHE